MINTIQKWSDEHPEEPKLTRKEYNFLSSFKKIDSRYICRGCAGTCFVLLADIDRQEWIADDMFSFIQKSNGWPFKDLLKLEVEDE